MGLFGIGSLNKFTFSGNYSVDEGCDAHTSYFWSVSARHTYERMAGIDLQNDYRESIFANIYR